MGLAAVHVGQRRQQLAGPVQHLRLRQRLAMLLHVAVQQIAQVLPLHIVHDQVLDPALDEVVGDLGQIGMIQRRKDLGLGIELIAQLVPGGLVGERLGNVLLDGQQTPLQARVLGQVDGAHAALAQETNDTIIAL
ncbi:MAG: hypothetical protein V9H69_22805 [Anaerolineae bacterium]